MSNPNISGTTPSARIACGAHWIPNQPPGGAACCERHPPRHRRCLRHRCRHPWHQPHAAPGVRAAPVGGAPRRRGPRFTGPACHGTSLVAAVP
eukprot:scaffold109244_cov48-Phaeocystis_antarctica.AAC.1